MARRLEFGHDALTVRYSGVSALARVADEVRVPYEHIRGVRVGVDRLPWTFALRVGVSTAPLGDTRRGFFWQEGKRLFYDVGDRTRAVAIDLDDDRFDRVVLEPESDPQELADELRRRAGIA